MKAGLTQGPLAPSPDNLELPQRKLSSIKELTQVGRTNCTQTINFLVVVNNCQSCALPLTPALFHPFISSHLRQLGRNFIRFCVTLCTDMTRAGELANFLAAPAPDFFFKRLRLRLLIFFPSRSGSSSWYFSFERLRLWLQGAKNTRLRLLGKIVFSLQTSKVKLQKIKNK